MGFETNVFVNCPFDDAYLPILRPILFCVIALGMDPRIALERMDSGEPRVEKIVGLIRDSKFGIHDLSRLKADHKGQLFRLNMPFELGLDAGCRTFGSGPHTEKRCLILEAERFRYQAAISDISGSDIAVHGNRPVEALTQVRNWLSVAADLKAPGPTKLWNHFNDFNAIHFRDLADRGYSPKDAKRQPISELLPAMKAWAGLNPIAT